VTADPNGKNPLVNNRTVAGAWERFSVTHNSDDTVYLTAGVNGKYVTADNGGASPLINNRTSAGAWETFALVS
jgi:hypothetical protein